MKNKLVNKSIVKVIKKNIVVTIFLIFIIVGVVLLSLLPPQILKQIIDANLLPNKAAGLLNLAFIYLITIIFIGVFDFLKEAILTVLGQKITTGIKIEMMEKLKRLSAKFYVSNDSGALVSRFTNDVDAISSMFTSGIVGMLIDSFKIIGIIFSIWLFSSNLGILTVVLLPLVYFITRIFQKSMLLVQIKNKILLGQLNNHISESLKNILMIKSYSKEIYMEENYKKILIENFKTIEKVNFYDSVFPPIIQLTRAIVIGFIAILSSKELNYLGISLGMVAASIDLFSNLFSPIENLGMELQNIQGAISGITRVNDFYNESEDEPKKEDMRVNHIIPNRGDVKISFNNVNFHYEDGTEVLNDIDLKVRPLEKITFVGRTGVGKSTLFKLILGLLKPSKGSITVNGIDVYSLPNSQKRKIFGYVEQSFRMIEGTVLEQISLKDNDITEEQIKDAIEFVGLTDYISTLNNGLYTIVSRDDIFSQGQKQLLGIARAIVTNPPILLLDEITANLDSITEEKVVSLLQNSSKNYTMLSISHRLSSMIASDKVVILKDGKIKNQGTPEQLLQIDEWYRDNTELEKLTWN